MKLVRFKVGDEDRPGLVVGDNVIDLRTCTDGFSSMREIVAGGAPALARLRSLQGARPDHRLADLKLLAPLDRPGKYLAIGMNYKKHIEEAASVGVPAPKQQLWFNKQTSCIAGPYDVIDPGVTQQLDYEVELGVVIGAPAKHVSAQRALEHVFGYVVANDVSARDWQFHSPTFTVGKSFDTHGPIGPWIVTADEIPDPQALPLRCLVNGEVRQSATTRDMIYSVAAQIEYLSTAFTLESGDLLATGTPEGVGLGMKPQVFLRPGDRVRCEIEGIGAIENQVKGE